MLQRACMHTLHDVAGLNCNLLWLQASKTKYLVWWVFLACIRDLSIKLHGYLLLLECDLRKLEIHELLVCCL